jgi:pimeloyl-ACP methyl ester carboxylesterase
MNRWYESAGARLHFRDAGAGFPVVFLHPTPLDGEFWRPVIGDLSGIRAVVPDLRGHGKSELGGDLPVGGFSLVPDAPVLTIRQLASDVISLLDHLELDEAAFVGCSIGGYVLLELWRRIPRRMKALAFVCSKAQADSEAGLAKRAATIAQIRTNGAGAFFDGLAQTLVGPTARERRPAIVNEVRAHMTLTAEATIAVQAGLACRSDSLAAVGTIDAPVLAACGGEDPAATQVEMEAFKAAPGGCEFHLLANVGHFAAYEQPERVAALLAEWMRES